jgi:DNA-directed RNA polymerase subunit H (RpoH/RPB5)
MDEEKINVCKSKFKNELNNFETNKEIKKKIIDGIYLYYDKNGFKNEFDIVNIINNLYKMMINRFIQFNNDKSEIDKILHLNVPDNILKQLINSYFVSYFNNDKKNINILDKYLNYNGKKIYSKFDIEPTKSAIIKDYIDLSKELKLESNKDDFIYIIRNIQKVNQETEKNIIQELEKKYENLTIFSLKRLGLNLIEHFYVPKHSKLKEIEKLDLKKKLHLKNYSQLPILKKNDAVSKYYNFRYGDVIKIERTGNQWAVSKDGGALGKYNVFRYIPKPK